MYINDKSKPLVLLGSNAALYVISDICAEHGINIAGVLDSDPDDEKCCDKHGWF